MNKKKEEQEKISRENEQQNDWQKTEGRKYASKRKERGMKEKKKNI